MLAHLFGITIIVMIIIILGRYIGKALQSKLAAEFVDER